MNSVVIAISVAYVVMAVLLLCMGLTSRFNWRIKGAVIVITSFFFVESFYATKSLLSWPEEGMRSCLVEKSKLKRSLAKIDFNGLADAWADRILSLEKALGTVDCFNRLELLQARVVEPDAKSGDAGAIFYWVEELDENHVPSGTPRSVRLPYTQVAADRASKAQKEISNDNPQEIDFGNLDGSDDQQQRVSEDTKLDQLNGPNRPETGLSNIEIDMLRQAQQIEFRPLSGPVLPPKR